MKYWIKSLLIIISFSTLICCGCSWFDGNSLGEDEIKCRVLWRVPTSADGNQRMRLENGIVYYSETYSDGIMAVDAGDGSVIWRNKDLISFASVANFLHDDSVVFTASNRFEGIYYSIYVFNKADGELQKAIHFKEKQYASFNYDSYIKGDKIYWSAQKLGIVELDLDKDLVWDDSLNAWTGTPRLVKPWPSHLVYDPGILNTVPRIYDEVLYGGYEYNWGEGIYYAVDVETGETLWENSNGEFIGQEKPVLMLDGKLIVENFGYGIVDPKTGEFLYANSGIESAYPADSGSFYHDGKMFMASPKPPSTEKSNIYCVEAMTGKVLWENNRPGTHGTNPIVHNGVMYIAMQDQIELFNAETGEYLGSDMSLEGDMWQLCNALKYEDTMIFRNSKELISIKLDFYLDSKGRLCQE